jgi:hypothetical protein
MACARNVLKNINQRAKKMDELNETEVANRIVGDLLTLEKYRFVGGALIADVAKEAIDRVVETRRYRMSRSTLDSAWKSRLQLYAEGAKLWAEGRRLDAEGDKLWAESCRLKAEYDKLCAESYRLKAEYDKSWAEGTKLLAEGDKLYAEGDRLWAEAILEVRGNVQVKWTDKGCEVEGVEYLHD